MLAAGNTVVIKASEVSQFTSALLAQLLENAFEKVTENMQDVPELTDFDVNSLLTRSSKQIFFAA
jgi:acyl-CoA reductase-like NAD-dependent aldehyde dehydrogenase